MSFKNTILTGPAGVFKHGSIKNHVVTAALVTAYTNVKPGLFVKPAGSDVGANTAVADGAQGDATHVILEGGTHIGEDVETVYVAGDSVRVATLRSGETLNARVPSALAITEDARYTAGDDGLIKAFTLNAVPAGGVLVALETSAAGSERLVAFKAL